MATPQIETKTSLVQEKEQMINHRSAFRWAQLSVVGTRGGTNQDAVLVQPPNFFGVADGVGGGSYGEVASSVTLRHCADAPEINGAALSTWVKESDEVVASSIARLSDSPGGATLVAVWLQGMRTHLLHVGDARAFLFRKNWRGHWHLTWQTLDQTYANNQLSPPVGGSPYDPCQMIGTGAVGEPGRHDFRMQEDDFLLLCTDGLHRFVQETAIHRIINSGARSGLSLDEIAGELIVKAQQNGSYDDITVLLLRRKRPRWRLWALVSTAVILAAYAVFVYSMP